MEVSDIIKLIRSNVDHLEPGETAFKELYDNLSSSEDGQEQLENSIRLWLYMEENRYIPEDLKGEDDVFLAKALIALADTIYQTAPIEYAFVLMHHRLMLSDYLEKVYIAEVFLSCLLEHREMVDEIIDDFLREASGDTLYMADLDPEDIDIDNPLLPDEMMRALLPYLRWMKTTYPQYTNLDAIFTEDYLQTMSAFEDARRDSKPPLKKLSAVCHYLYEKIHIIP